MFDVISKEEAVEADNDRCDEWGGVPVGSMVRWVGDNLWRRKDATDTVLLHLTRTDLGEEVRLRTTADAKSGVSMACLWIQAVAGGQKRKRRYRPGME